MRTLLFFMVCVVLLASCKQKLNGYSGMGKKPVYLPLDSLTDIRNTSPQPIGKTGTIFLRDSLLFLLEEYKGIHVINVNDSSNPRPITFIKIPAVSDFTLGGDKLYADNGPNLLSISIADIFNVVLISKNNQVFKPVLFPSLFIGPFECVDETKGIVIGWEDAYLENVSCSRQ